MKTKFTLHLLGLILVVCGAQQSFAQGTAFIYQGDLSQHGRPARGEYDLRFEVYSSSTNGTPITSLEIASVRVQEGEFTASLDFGAGVFDGSDRWLEISVKQRHGDFIPLRPRQQIKPVPYAIMANSASNLLGTLPASQIAGSIPAAQLDGPLPPTALAGTYPAAVNLHNPSNQFAGDGSQLAYVNATTLNGLTASNFWKLDGNAGTTPGANFLGTTDERAFELKVNNLRALRIEPGSNSAPNIIGGYAGNFAATMRLFDDNKGGEIVHFYPTGIYGATISGGGSPNQTNIVASSFGTIGGGAANLIEKSQTYGTIGGGLSNQLKSSDIGRYSTIAGGFSNKVYGTGAVIGGGMENMVGNRYSSRDAGQTIAGGSRNRIGYEHSYSTIGGGSLNFADSAYATVAGGYANSIVWTGGEGNTIGGGGNNYIKAANTGVNPVVIPGYSVISGGGSNRIEVPSVQFQADIEIPQCKASLLQPVTGPRRFTAVLSSGPTAAMLISPPSPTIPFQSVPPGAPGLYRPLIPMASPLRA
ncbi:MAG: hypothetical protein QM813_08110 [Verrucomicrobiota bacterium]